MPVFVHLTSHRNMASIRRSGIGLGSGRGRAAGVYAMPVTRDFYVSHQWLRELRRWGAGTVFGVYFRLPADEPVSVGHYNRPYVGMTAAEAVALMMGSEAGDGSRSRRPASREGYEVIVPRRIDVSELIRVKPLPQVVGWRYKPGAHGSAPCVCRCCPGGGRGQYGAGKLLRRLEAAEAADRPTKIVVFGRGDDSFRRVERLRRRKS